MRAHIGILAGVLAAVVLGGASALAILDSSDGSSPSRPPPTSSAGHRYSDGEPRVRGCRERIEGRFLEPDPKTDTRIGPVTFLDAPASYRHYASRRDAELQPSPGVGLPAIKIIVLVNSGERTTLTVPRQQRRWVRLLYLHEDFPRGTHKAILQGCRRLSSQSARRRECGRGPTTLKGAHWACTSRYTQFSGGFALDFANAPRRGRCAQLIVQTQGKQTTLRKHLFDRNPRACRPSAA